MRRYLSDDRRQHVEDSAVRQRLRQQPAGRVPPEAVCAGAGGVQPAFPPRLPAALLEDRYKGGAEGTLTTM